MNMEFVAQCSLAENAVEIERSECMAIYSYELSMYMSIYIDKLEGVNGDLVRTNDEGRDWDFPLS